MAAGVLVWGSVYVLGMGGAAPGAALLGHRSSCLYFACQCWNFRPALYGKGGSGAVRLTLTTAHACPNDLSQ